MDFVQLLLFVLMSVIIGLSSFIKGKNEGIDIGIDMGIKKCQQANEKADLAKQKSDEFPKHFTVNGVHCIALNDKAISCDWNNTTQKQGENYE